jgi:sugar lactone lactonase YvrE
MAFGGIDGKTLFITARKAVYRVPVKIAGIYP